MRTLLTLLGITWGTVSVALLVAFGEGLEERIRKNQRGLGESIVIAWPARTSLPWNGLGKGRPIKVSEDDIAALRKEIPDAVFSGEFSREKSAFRRERARLTPTLDMEKFRTLRGFLDGDEPDEPDEPDITPDGEETWPDAPPGHAGDPRKPITLQGEAVERGTRRKLSGIIVSIVELGLDTITDDDGKFYFHGVAPGDWTLLAVDDRFDRFKRQIEIFKGEVLDARLWMNPTGGNPYETIVEGERETFEVTRRTLQRRPDGQEEPPP